MTLPSFLCSMLFINFDKTVSFQGEGLQTRLLFSRFGSYCEQMYSDLPKIEHSFKIQCIAIKVEYGLQLHFKIFLNKSDRKDNNKNNH